MRSEDDRIARMWEQYLARRKAGGRTEMFRDREDARWWLKQIIPVKYIDGAWLSYTNNITTPSTLWRTVKDAFQVLSEELGDGDLAKNHVHVYHQLMKEVEPGLPAGAWRQRRFYTSTISNVLRKAASLLEAEPQKLRLSKLGPTRQEYIFQAALSEIEGSRGEGSMNRNLLPN